MKNARQNVTVIFYIVLLVRIKLSDGCLATGNGNDGGGFTPMRK